MDRPLTWVPWAAVGGLQGWLAALAVAIVLLAAGLGVPAATEPGAWPAALGWLLGAPLHLQATGPISGLPIGMTADLRVPYLPAMAAAGAGFGLVGAVLARRLRSASELESLAAGVLPAPFAAAAAALFTAAVPARAFAIPLSSGALHVLAAVSPGHAAAAALLCASVLGAAGAVGRYAVWSRGTPERWAAFSIGMRPALLGALAALGLAAVGAIPLEGIALTRLHPPAVEDRTRAAGLIVGAVLGSTALAPVRAAGVALVGRIEAAAPPPSAGTPRPAGTPRSTAHHPARATAPAPVRVRVTPAAVALGRDAMPTPFPGDGAMALAALAVALGGCLAGRLAGPERCGRVAAGFVPLVAAGLFLGSQFWTTWASGSLLIPGMIDAPGLHLWTVWRPDPTSALAAGVLWGVAGGVAACFSGRGKRPGAGRPPERKFLRGAGT